MTTAVGVASPWLYTVSYLTIDEFKAAPTAVDVKNLNRGGTAAQQDAELANVIARASAWVNTICGQNLAATTDTETGRVRVNRAGEIIVHPRYWPILEVTDFEIGPMPSQLSVIPLTECWIEREQFTVLDSAFGLSSSVGPLQFSAASPAYRSFARWTYVNGWPTTTLHTAINGTGATSIIVEDATGIYAGTRLTIFDAEHTESFVVTSVAGTTLTVPALTYAHATTGRSISALPPTVKEACISLTAAFVKARGADAVVMSSIDMQADQVQPAYRSAVSDASRARELLALFHTIR